MSDVQGTTRPVMPHGASTGQGHGEPRDGARPARGGPAPTPGTSRTSSAVTLLVVAGLSTMIGLFTAVPAVVLGILAVAYQSESPSRSATFTRWGWIAYAAGALVLVLAGAALMVVAVYAASGNT